MKIAVVIPVLTNWEGAIKALESIKTKFTWQPYIIPQWRIDQSLAAAWNLGINMAWNDGYDFCLVINDDVLFAPQTMDALVNCWYSLPDNKCRIITATNMRGLIKPHEIYNFTSLVEVENEYSESPDFSAFTIHTSTFNDIGKFDERFYPAFFEDNDFCYRLRLAGYKALRALHVPYYHFGSTTHNELVRKQGFVRHSMFEEGMKYYKKKWGGEPGNEIFLKEFNGKKR